MPKSRRKHYPCRKCGMEHKNPLSSSICTICGPKEAAKNRERRRKEREPGELPDWETFARGVSEDIKRFYKRPWYVRAWLAATGKFKGKYISIG